MIQSKYSRNNPVRTGSGRQIPPPARSALVLLLVLLSACAPVPPRPQLPGDDATQSARETILGARPSWSFTGRMALSQGGNGGSARIVWVQDGADFDIRLSAPITRQSWRLRQYQGKVSLEGLDGGLRQGVDAEALLLEASGWRIPVKAMAAWVRGMRAPGAAQLSFDPQGLPATLAQDGWAVEYRAWFPLTPALPAKVFARQGQASVRLIVETWDQP
jgi:outer membrane lipoprotein LolB